MKSHPIWMRGLKLRARITVETPNQSHPIWMRGLKLSVFVGLLIGLVVASYMDAWIEIVLICVI